MKKDLSRESNMKSGEPGDQLEELYEQDSLIHFWLIRRRFSSNTLRGSEPGDQLARRCLFATRSHFCLIGHCPHFFIRFAQKEHYAYTIDLLQFPSTQRLPSTRGSKTAPTRLLGSLLVTVLLVHDRHELKEVLVGMRKLLLNAIRYRTDYNDHLPCRLNPRITGISVSIGIALLVLNGSRRNRMISESRQKCGKGSPAACTSAGYCLILNICLVQMALSI
jgi:hypothetical protein